MLKIQVHWLAFMAYDKFENFKRPDDMNIVDYINEFERLNNQVKHFDMELPTDVYIKWKAAIDTSNYSYSYIW